MADKKTLKRVHSTPGVYFSEMELTYAQKSLGITRLGVAGETQKGPAFQPIEVSDWAHSKHSSEVRIQRSSVVVNIQSMNSLILQKNIFSQSQQLQVCRVLGLSGVNAGAAWCITAYDDKATKQDTQYTKDRPLVIAVIRSRGEHVKAAFKRKADPDAGICNDVYDYDGINYYARNVKIRPSDSLDYLDDCNPSFNKKKGVLTINANNYGIFTLEVETSRKDSKGDYETVFYSVSLNPGDKNYIINVLGQDPEVGESEIYVEELYDIALEQLIKRGEINALAEIKEEKGKYVSTDLVSYPEIKVIPNHKAVDAILTLNNTTLTRRHVGKRFLFSNSESVNPLDNKPLKVHKSSDKGSTWVEADGEVGHIYTVVAHTRPDGKREYLYGEYVKNETKLKKQNMCLSS